MITLKHYLFVFCLSLLNFFLIGQQFQNGDFETIVGPCTESDCNYDASAFDCIPYWTDEYASTGSIVFLQSATCVGDVVCDGNYSVRLSTGAGSIPATKMSTPNPFYMAEEGTYLITLVVSGDQQNYSIFEIKGINEQGVNEAGLRVGWQGVEETDECTTLTIPLSSNVVNFPFLSFNLIGTEAGLTDIYLDNIEACGKAYDFYYDPCTEQINLTFNRDCPFAENSIWSVSMRNLRTDNSHVHNDLGPGPDAQLPALPGDEIRVYIQAAAPAPDRAGSTVLTFFTYQIPEDGPPCCEDFNDANFDLNLISNGNGLNIEVANFELYEEQNAEHYWFIYSVSSNPAPGELPTPITYASTEGVGPHPIFSGGEYGVTYIVIHQVRSDCGTICEYRSDAIHIFDPSGLTEGGNEGLQPEASLFEELCVLVETDFQICESTDLPTISGLTSVQNGLSITLSWDEAPGTHAYEVASTSTADCDCGGTPVPNISLQTSSNTITIPATSLNRCFAWHVRAVCTDSGETGPWSTPNCFDNGFMNLSDEQSTSSTIQSTPLAKAFPNPATDQLTLSLNLSYDSPVLIELFQVNGLKIADYHTEVEVTAHTPISVKWKALDQLNSGVYFVRYTTQQESFTSTIIIN